MINALRSETDSLNAQYLLVGLLSCCQDLAEQEIRSGVGKEGHYPLKPDASSYSGGGRRGVTIDNQGVVTTDIDAVDSLPNSESGRDMMTEAQLGKEGIPGIILIICFTA